MKHFAIVIALLCGASALSTESHVIVDFQTIEPVVVSVNDSNGIPVYNAKVSIQSKILEALAVSPGDSQVSKFARSALITARGVHTDRLGMALAYSGGGGASSSTQRGMIIVVDGRVSVKADGYKPYTMHFRRRLHSKEEDAVATRINVVLVSSDSPESQKASRGTEKRDGR